MNKYKIITMSLVFATSLFVSCDNNDSSTNSTPEFAGNYVLQDQMARPAINTVFTNGN